MSRSGTPRTRAAIAAIAVIVASIVVIAAPASGQPSRLAPPAAEAGGTVATAAAGAAVADDVLAARLATSKYATNLGRARADGYQIITRMIPNMGYHFMNPSVTGVNLRRPPILVYEHHAGKWQLGALEWVFTSMPASPPLPGAQYGVFAAACHYVDGTFVFADAQSQCAAKSPQTGAKFNFWHPRLITLHFWVWYPNPAGIYSGTNPLVTPFNGG